VVTELYIVFDAAGLARLRPGDRALAVGAAARLPAPPGVALYVDAEELAAPPAGVTPLDARGVVALLFEARRVSHW
jgi:hypothetical protein